MELEIEKAGDTAEVEALFDLCFGLSRGMLSSYRLREGVAAVGELCFVLREGGAVIGAIRYWPVRVGDAGDGANDGVGDGVGDAGAKALLLGPVAVHPTHQGEGLGAWLIRHSLSAARAEGWARVILIGDESYYGRYGFTRHDLQFPPPTDSARILTLALEQDAWEGVGGLVVSY